LLIPAFRPSSFAGSPPNTTVLGAVAYAVQPRDPHFDNGFPTLTVHMVDDTADAFTEVWYTDRQVEHGTLDGVVHAHDGEYLFCAVGVSETNNCTDAVRSAYLRAISLTQKLGYRQIFRMWNFVENINGENSEGLEVYRDFCRGRAQAFSELTFAEKRLPAATGVGSLGGGIGFCLLASRSARCVNIENSRQVPAYRYPKRHGPSPPSFARATHVAPAGDDSGRGQIYVSGTASVIGHLTKHRGQVAAQCHETLANIEHLLSADNLAAHGVRPGRRLVDLRNIKVYVRNQQDLPAVQEICAKAFSPGSDAAFLNVDICRSDLLVEIEGIVLPGADERMSASPR
jgi:chorismate lyase / 3-hydroxybenzoate synthase